MGKNKFLFLFLLFCRLFFLFFYPLSLRHQHVTLSLSLWLCSSDHPCFPIFPRKMFACRQTFFFCGNYEISIFSKFGWISFQNVSKLGVTKFLCEEPKIIYDVKICSSQERFVKIFGKKTQRNKLRKVFCIIEATFDELTLPTF